MPHRFILIILLGLPLTVLPAARAAVVSVELEFSAPPLLFEAGAGADLERVTLPGCSDFGLPGEPLLPACGAVVLLPPGEQVVAVHVIPANARELPGVHRLLHAPTPQPISFSGPWLPALANERIYGSNAPFPPEPVCLVTEARAWGHGLAFLRVSPVCYRPASGRVSWFPQVSVKIETAPAAPATQAAARARLRRTPAVIEQLGRLVANAQDLPAYANYAPQAPVPEGAGRLEPDFFPYLIVTHGSLASAFEQVALFHAGRGLRATVVLIEDILAGWPGQDAAEQLRNFIIDAYQNWSTEYVLLGGDTSLLPIRKLYGNIQGFEGQFPGECYYEGLDGTWNDDGDALWGEWGEWDLVGEVAVGRACVETQAEFDRWWHKNVMVAEQPVLAEIEKGLFLGEQLDPQTWGGHYMDEVKDYAATHGYTTSGYPAHYAKETRYDLHYVWEGQEVIDLINQQGFPTTHHLGHSGWDMVMKIDSNDLHLFTNDGVTHSYMINYSQGCDANRFDYPGGDDAISEKLVYDEHASAAFIGNTRYGWFFPAATNGPSQHYERQFVDAVYGEGIVTLGWMNVDSKTDNIWQLTDWLQWCHYELCLVGDPALPQWRTCSGALELAHAGTHVIGQDNYDVSVFAAGAPVAGAGVTVYSPDLTVWSHAVTDSLGRALVPLQVTTPATLQLKSVKPDYLHAVDSLIVSPASGPWLRLTQVELDDAQAPAVGDGDGLADAGELLALTLTIENIGPEPAVNAALALGCTDPRLTIMDGAAACGTIPPGGNGANVDDLLVQVTTAAGDGDIASIDLTITCDGRPTWTGAFGLVLHAPILSLAGWAIEDSTYGDGQGDFDPGERIGLRITLANAGSDEGRGLTGLLTSASPWVTITGAEGACPYIPRQGTENLAPPFDVTANPAVPTDLDISFELAVTTGAGQSTEMSFAVPVASFFDDDFEADLGWTAGVPGDDATAGIWIRVDPIGTWGSGIPVQPEDDHSPLGTHCYVTGQGVPGGAPMSSDVDGGQTTLLSPLLDLTTAHEPRLVYWRWWTNNYGPWSGEDVWHVDISDDGGGSWTALENVFTGINEWVRMEFALEDFITLSDQVRIRFIASDRTHDSLIEAAIDDLAIESLPGTADAPEGDPAQMLAGSFGILGITPNPARTGTAGLVAGPAGGVVLRYAVPDAGDAQVRVYDLRGRLIANVADGPGRPGERRVVWDGRSFDGRPVSPGVYFCRLSWGGQRAHAKLTVVR